LTGTQDLTNQDPNNVPNGIAYDAYGDRLFVTGKMWPHFFEVNLIPSAWPLGYVHVVSSQAD
jgi:glutamine cyclotransferase